MRLANNSKLFGVSLSDFVVFFGGCVYDDPQKIHNSDIGRLIWSICRRAAIGRPRLSISRYRSACRLDADKQLAATPKLYSKRLFFTNEDIIIKL